MTDTIIQSLNNRAIKDEYLYELLKKAQFNYGCRTLSMEYESLSDMEFLGLLRFSDILSRSTDSLNRNIALKIISILFDEYNDNATYQLFSKNCLVKLGNFPSLGLVEKEEIVLENDEIAYDEIIKQLFQKTSNANQYFTDSQYEIFNDLKNTNYYSFSAGTSFGKSFMFVEYVKWLISSKNASENFAFLVPTRALITQVINDLNENIDDDRYEIVQNAEIPALYRHKKLILVFTPERLISYFSKIDNPVISTIIIDEAHNTVADDERSPLFYHAISLANQRSVHLFFASPNVPNPDLFLNLIGNAPDKSQHVQDVNVVQSKFFIDLLDHKARIYFDYVGASLFEEFSFQSQKNVEEIIRDLAGDSQSLIYCNSVSDTVLYAKKMAQISDQQNEPELNNLARYIRDTVHSLYYLAEFIEKGVGFHFGGLPQTIRVRVEEQFKKGKIKYLFTTSTLLQGVNLPAKNLFVLTDKIGQNKNLTDLDFKNLVGRAGRLSKELIGNIFVVRVEQNKWKEKSQKLLENIELPRLSSKILEKSNQNFYDKIGMVIQNKPLPKSISQWQRRQLVEYAGILVYQTRIKTDSVLSTQFVQRSKEAVKVLSDISRIEIPQEVLMVSIAIKPQYQLQIQDENNHFVFPTGFEYGDCLSILSTLSNKYSWTLEEDKRMLGNERRLGYYAVLMSEWLKSQPLNVIIQSTIRYMESNHFEISINNNPLSREVFNKENPAHINHLINELMKDIENIIRFKIKNYVTNYLKLTTDGDNDWQKYLDYGTSDLIVIELQKLGFERQAAIEIKGKQCEDFFELNRNQEIVGINLTEIKKEEFSEITQSQIDIIFGEFDGIGEESL